MKTLVEQFLEERNLIGDLKWKLQSVRNNIGDTGRRIHKALTNPVYYHGTHGLAAAEIEKHGILPNSMLPKGHSNFEESDEDKQRAKSVYLVPDRIDAEHRWARQIADRRPENNYSAVVRVRLPRFKALMMRPDKKAKTTDALMHKGPIDKSSIEGVNYIPRPGRSLFHPLTGHLSQEYIEDMNDKIGSDDPSRYDLAPKYR